MAIIIAFVAVFVFVVLSLLLLIAYRIGQSSGNYEIRRLMEVGADVHEYLKTKRKAKNEQAV